MENLDGLYSDDQLARDSLSACGWQVDNVPWTTSNVRWSNYEVVVIRSTWDYQNDPDRFLRVLGEIDASLARLENSLEIVRWNIRKTYLKDIEQDGVPIVKTRWLTGLDPVHVQELRKDLGCEELVVKPVISANADDTIQIGTDPAVLQRAVETFRNRELIVQPFVDTIQTLGEYSLFYFGGMYSHCVLKTPMAGDFRVQEEHGGIVKSVTPDDDVLEAGRRTYEAIPSAVLYARIDLVRIDNRVAVMEVELIEPSLYFAYHPASSTNFAEAVHRL